MTTRFAPFSSRSAILGLVLLLHTSALAQEPVPEPSPTGDTVRADDPIHRSPRVTEAKSVNISLVKRSLEDVVRYFSSLTGRTLLLDDPKSLKDEITIIAYGPVTGIEAYEALLSALEAKGYTTMTSGNVTRIIKSSNASQSPIAVRSGGDIPETWEYITQIMPLDNVSVSDVQSVAQAMMSPNAKLIAYAPSNTLIMTDSAVNLRKVYKLIKELDIAAPKSRLAFVPLQYAEATEVQQIIEQLYGTAEKSTSKKPNKSRNRRNKGKAKTNQTGMTTAGKESSYISKVIAEERTNSIIVLANEEGHAAVAKLIKELDVDVDPNNRSQIHVVNLEHAKAVDVAQVLSNLSQTGGGSGSNSRSTNSRRPTGRNNTAGKSDKSKSTGVTAAFDSGMRITEDENTNSLVIIASNEDFRVVKSVIDKLDIRRRQVYVDCVILELSSDDSLSLGVAYHTPQIDENGVMRFIGGQFGTSSLGLTQDLLSGLAVGIFGDAIDVNMAGQTVSVPAFGVVLNALKGNSAVNIVSNPNLLTLDNEEAKIVVGRKIPFPTQSSVNNITGVPIVSYQREDVAITLKVTPRVNSSNFVTLETVLEVSEVAQDQGGLSASTSGFITSKREVETVALVGNNQTVVLGGLMASTETDAETKVPILGDLPIIGALFRGKTKKARRTNLMIFLTPHIIDDENDMLQVMRVKEAQRREFIRRFYGRSQNEQQEALRSLLQYSMNYIDEDSVYQIPEEQQWDEGESSDLPLSPEGIRALEEVLDDLPEEEN